MNNGPSVRLQPANTGQGGRPMIFWEQQAIEAKNQKARKQQFGYKDKTVRKILRDKVPGPEPRTENNKRTTNNKETVKTSNKRTGSQNSKNATKSKPDVNTVTLTQKQLDTILDTIGHLTLENEELHVKNPSGEIRGPIVTTESQPKGSRDTTQSKGSGENSTVVVAQSEIPGLENHVPPGAGQNAGDRPSANVQTVGPAAFQAVSPPGQNAGRPPVPMTKAELKRRQWELERAEQEKIEAQAGARVTAASVAATVATPSSNVNQQKGAAIGGNYDHSPGLSKMQQKRLQWERERADLPKDFDPWGKPGAGAPLRDTGGSVLADYTNRKAQDYQDSGSSKQAWADSNANVLRKQEFSSPRHQPSPSWAKDQPAALMSSFAVGNIAPDDTQFLDVKGAQKKQWLADLEKQKEENRLQKLREKQQQQDGEDRWADRFSNYKPAGVPEQPTVTRPTETERISSAPTAAPLAQPPSLLAGQDLSNSQSASHLRGQNAPLDPLTKRELEDKRRIYQEHQDAIKAQMEERQRLKREEREQRHREEREDEEKMAKERDTMNAQFKNEKLKQREKEEAQKRRVDVMKEAMDKAQQDAEREKHKRRLERLQQGGHDTSHLQANFEAKMTPRMVGGVIVPTPVAVGAATNTSNVTVVAPTFIPGLHPSPRREDPPQVYGSDEPYVENRVLTPTPYRGQEIPKKEFGVQTDPSLMRNMRGSYNDVDLPPHGERNSRKVRLKSPTEEKGMRETKKGPMKISERPKWGATQQNKKLVKQSERDLRIQQKKEEAVARRLARQQQMLEMAERNAPKVSLRTTNASRTRSLSRNREDNNAAHQRRHSPEERNVVSTQEPTSVNARSRHHLHNQSPSREVQSVSHAGNGHSRVSNNRNSDNTSHRSHRVGPNDRASPPIPSISHRDNDRDSYKRGNFDRITFSSRTPNHEMYQDSDLTGRTSDNSFVPFVRTQEVLDPAHADDPVPISREPTAIQKARQAYHESHEPANYGTHIRNIEERPIQESIPSNWLKDPIMNPTVVTGHPTPRQDRILQQLSDLRKGLRQKQRELEVGMSTMSLVEDP